MTRGARSGLVFLSALVVLALSGVMIAAYFTVLQLEINAGARAAGRVQALYLAEAGLAAAHDALARDWNQLNAGPLRLRESITIPTDTGSILMGEYDVVAAPLSRTSARLVSVGRTRPGQDAEPGQEGISRSLVAVVVARIRPSFSRLGTFGTLESSTEYGKDGLPSSVVFSGRLEPEPGSRGPGRLLVAGTGAMPSMGPDLVAGFHDVDGDGDLDLLLGGMTTTETGTYLAAVSLPPGQDPPLAMTATAVDLLGTGSPIPVITAGWLPLPEGWLTRTGPGVDVFLNALALDDTSVVSWSELSMDQAVALLSSPAALQQNTFGARAEPQRLSPTAGGRP